MPRYIDADALIKTIFPYDMVDKKCYSINAKAIAYAIDNTPTADVVPKSEVEELNRECESLGKTVNEASELIRKLKGKVEEDKAKVAREIFEEIESDYADFLFDGYRNIIVLTEKDYTELKKKYTEEKKHEN